MWIILSLLILGALTLLLGYYVSKKKKRPTDYYTLFIMGIVFLPIGVATENYPLAVLGMTFSVVGLINKDKWKKNKQTWETLSKKERKFMIVTIAIITLLLVSGIATFFLFNKN